MSIRNTYPTIRPSLNLNFARSRTLDPRITFSRSSVGTYMDANGLIVTASADEPRFDHRYVNGEIESLGLLVEEQRSNYILNSNNADANGKQNITTSLETIIDPTGFFSSVRKIQITGDAPSPTTYSARWGNTTSGDNTSPYSGSVWARSESGTVDIEIDMNDSTRNSFTLDETWRRISVSRDSRTEPYQFFDIRVNDGQAGSSFYVWGLQIEKGSFPTSYIPTEGSTKTRNQDNTSMTGTNFSDWYNPTEGTIFLDCTPVYNNSTNQYRRLLSIHNNSGAQIDVIQFIQTEQTNQVLSAVWDGASPQSGFGKVVTSGTRYKVAFAVKENNMNASYDGNIGTDDTTCTLPVMTEMDIGSYNTFSSTQTTMHINNISYYPRRLTNTQLQNLTK